VRKNSGVRRAVPVRSALVVEEDEGTRQSLVHLLEEEGFEVLTATTLERARYILFESSHPVGVLVLALRLADGDGERLLEALSREDNKSVPVVLLSRREDRGGELGALYGLPVIDQPFESAVAAATITMAFDNDVRPYLRRTT
jgi:DNA-binding response OmpR family regulator